MKTIKTVNTVSLIMLTVSYLVFAGNIFFDAAVSDNLMRVNGIVTLISLPVFVFTTIKIRMANK
ncbi:MAG: hypothetical protein K6B74_13725 [Ruminococcus sp.]|nr:hypothetical protein [Ruminococcus sp.]